jgi:hypothetical protein
MVWDNLQRGITSVRVGTSAPISATITILSFHRAREIARGLRDRHGDTQSVDFFVDAPWWATSHASNGAMWSREDREGDRHAAGRAVRKWEMGTLTKSASSGE